MNKFSSISNHDPDKKASTPFFQPKLSVNQPDDAYEQEANTVADKVMRMKNASPEKKFFSSGMQRKCADCEKEEKKAQRKENSNKPGKASVQTGEYINNLSGGKPLDNEDKSFFESRMDYDFSNVQLHTDAEANQSAKDINALAYTHGNDIIFGPGQYQPGTDEGKKLLAHELTHVVQQNSQNFNAVQKEEPKAEAKPVEKTDVALLLDDDPLAATEARSYAPVVIRATNSEDAKKQLLALGKPIRTLFVVSHSNRLGEVEVKSGIGTISWVKLSDFSKDLKGALPADKAPELVDFRGCKLGEAPGQMETFRQNISAQKARGTNCWSIVATVTPLTAPDGSAITTESQIPQGMEKQFNDALKTQVNGLKSNDGKSVKNCINGLAAGETADKNFKKIRELYFKGGGNLSAGWVSPEFNYDWQADSKCAKDITETTAPCKIVIRQAQAAETTEDKK